jgi:hypothetical protein
MDNNLYFNKTNIPVYIVTSEPGDCTCYDFYFIVDGDDYLIVPRKSTFKMPQRLNKWNMNVVIAEYEKGELKLGEAAEKILDDKSINPHTIVQVARAIYHIIED